jgi:membrane protein
LFPALFVVVSLLGMIGLSQDTLEAILSAVAEKTNSQWAVDVVSGVLDSIFASSSSSVFFGLGVLASLWSASGYIRSFMWASDQIYQVKTSRSYFRGLPIRVGLALLLITLFTAAVAMVTVIGPLSDRIAAALGVQGGELLDWFRLTSPLLLVITLLMLAFLYKYAPSRRQPHLLRLFAGAAVTMIGWVIASAGFSFYLANFASYNRVYGTLATGIAFLVWAWILNIAVLVGVEVNRALEGQPETEDTDPHPEGNHQEEALASASPTPASAPDTTSVSTTASEPAAASESAAASGCSSSSGPAVAQAESDREAGCRPDLPL